MPRDLFKCKPECPWLQKTPDGAVVKVHVQPGAMRTEVAGTHGDRLKIRIQSPPQDGKANKALCRFLSDLLGIPKQQVIICRGVKSRQKDIQLLNVSRQEAARILETPPAD